MASHLRVFGVSPNLVLLFTVSWVLLQGRGEGFLLGLVSGLVLDALSGAPFGLAIVSLAPVGALAGLGEINVFRTARVLPYVTIALATLIFEGLFLLMLCMLGGMTLEWSVLWRIVLPEVVINTLCMPIMYGLVRRVCDRARPPSVEWE